MIIRMFSIIKHIRETRTVAWGS